MGRGEARQSEVRWGTERDKRDGGESMFYVNGEEKGIQVRVWGMRIGSVRPSGVVQYLDESAAVNK